MPQDKRQQERITIVDSRLQEYLFLQLNGRWFPLQSIHDLSISGVGIYFSELIENDVPVKIAFSYGDKATVIRGRVIWAHCNPLINKSNFELRSFHIGIGFDPHDHEEVELMLQGLTIFLDISIRNLGGDLSI
jgi:hypothetical protein